jgi:hypothetical protein
MVVLDGNCAVGCGRGTDNVGWYPCCKLWVWNGLCWMVTVLQVVGLERIVLDGNCAVGWGLERIVLDGNSSVGCGSGTDCV